MSSPRAPSFEPGAVGREPAGASSAPSFAQMRDYLRRNDMLGYLVGAALPPETADVWTCFWYVTRRVDELVDKEGFDVVGRVGLGDPELADVFASAALFIEMAAPALYGDLEPARILYDVGSTIFVERDWVASGTAQLYGELQRVIYHKACATSQVSLGLMFPGDDPLVLRDFIALVAFAMQLTDDVQDLAADVRDGRLWISAEELDALGLTKDDVARGRGYGRIARWRERMILEHYERALDVAGRLRSDHRRWAQRMVQQFIRRNLVRRPRVDPPVAEVPRGPFERLDRLPLSEASLLRLLRSVTRLLKVVPAPRYRRVLLHRRLRQLEPVPAPFRPEETLRRMHEIRESLSRRYAAAGSPATVSALFASFHDGAAV